MLRSKHFDLTENKKLVYKGRDFSQQEWEAYGVCNKQSHRVTNLQNCLFFGCVHSYGSEAFPFPFVHLASITESRLIGGGLKTSDSKEDIG